MGRPWRPPRFRSGATIGHLVVVSNPGRPASAVFRSARPTPADPVQAANAAPAASCERAIGAGPGLELRAWTPASQLAPLRAGQDDGEFPWQRSRRRPRALPRHPLPKLRKKSPTWQSGTGFHPPSCGRSSVAQVRWSARRSSATSRRARRGADAEALCALEAARRIWTLPSGITFQLPVSCFVAGHRNGWSKRPMHGAGHGSFGAVHPPAVHSRAVGRNSRYLPRPPRRMIRGKALLMARWWRSCAMPPHQAPVIPAVSRWTIARRRETCPMPDAARHGPSARCSGRMAAVRRGCIPAAGAARWKPPGFCSWEGRNRSSTWIHSLPSRICGKAGRRACWHGCIGRTVLRRSSS